MIYKRQAEPDLSAGGIWKAALSVGGLNQIDFPRAWLSLDEGDNNPLRCVPCLAAAFQQVDDETG